MSVFNGETYLKEAIDSIINQTFKNFEFIIIDDASTDDSAEIISSYNDNRIIFIKNEKNLGLPASLNRGINLAKGKYIARMDDDDISFPERLEKQFKFMENHPEIGFSGTWGTYIPKTNPIRYKKFPVENDELQLALLSYNPFIHPSIIIRKSVLTKYQLSYNPEFRYSQDYELWVRLVHYSKTANLAESLVEYRIHDKQISTELVHQQDDFARRIVKMQLKKLEMIVNDEEADLIRNTLNNTIRNISPSTLLRIHQLLLKINHENVNKKVFPVALCHRRLEDRWATCVKRTVNHNFMTLFIILKSPFFLFKGISIKERFFFLKSIRHKLFRT